MRQRIWRSLFTAAAGLLATAGAASAQQTAPPPVAPPPMELIARPGPGPVVPTVPAVSGHVITPVHGAGFAPQVGGPYSLPPAPHYPPGVTGGRGYYMSGPVTETRLGSGINGCGSFKQDLSFVLGPCKSFFAPCGGLHNSCFGNGHGGGWSGKCGYATPVYGTGRFNGYNGCCYDSYANH